MNPAEKHQLAEQIKKHFRAHYVGDKPSRACLYWAQAAVEVLAKETGQRCIIQAGTMSWPIVTRTQDDGISPTHLTFQWQPEHIASCFARECGKMQELHVWSAIPETKEIIDMTTRFFPEIAFSLGLNWIGPSPPDYFMGAKDQLPEMAIYRPNMDAIKYALLLIEQSW